MGDRIDYQGNCATRNCANQKDTENYATVNVCRISQKGARFSVGGGSREAGVVVKPAGRGGAMPKIKVILQNDRKYYATPKVSFPR